jgi:hypothetical protein
MAVERLAVNATDPSADGALLAWHEPGATGLLASGDSRSRLGGTHPAVGGARLASLRDGVVDVQATGGAPFAATVATPGADAIAVSSAWLAWRAGNEIFVAPLAGGAARPVMRAADVGRPALEGNLLVFHVAGRSGGRIVLADLAAGRIRTIRRERRAQLLNPSLLGGWLLYVRAVYRQQELLIGPLARRSPRRDRSLWSTVPTGRRDAGHEPGIRHHRHGHPRGLWRRPRAGLALTLWTTALAADAAYVTRLRQIAGRPPEAELLRVPR